MSGLSQSTEMGGISLGRSKRNKVFDYDIKP